MLDLSFVSISPLWPQVDSIKWLKFIIYSLSKINTLRVKKPCMLCIIRQIRFVIFWTQHQWQVSDTSCCRLTYLMRYLCSAYLSATHLYRAKDSFFSFYGDRLSGDSGLALWFNVFVHKFLFLSMKEKTDDTFN